MFLLAHAMTMASIAWWRWSIRFLLKPLCDSRGIDGISCPFALLVVNCAVSSILFKRMKRGSIILFQTSFMPQSFFSLSVMPPVQVITFLEIASSSPSSLTMFDNRPFTTLLMYRLSFSCRAMKSSGIVSIISLRIFTRFWL